ncbi:MAG: amino acid adenylation domain-containing protein [Tateyamaria sp.]|jgi:amino acid adenylation domain-containing protein|uniref:non-ribosomal peptide synthetase n=2 Tax=Tateyamaria sp. TaxID=1929288 RepID=UPI0032DD184E
MEGALISQATPLTPSQELFWRGAQASPGDASYSMVWRFDLYQDIEPARFGTAIAQVVNESEALSSIFEDGSDGVVQRVGSHDFRLDDFVDLSGFSDPETMLQSGLNEWIQLPFDLSQTTYRARLVKMGTDHWVWLSAQHHIACDAQSGALFFHVVSERYAKPDTLLSSAPSYFDAARRIAAAVSPSDRAAARTTPQSPPYGGPSKRHTGSSRAQLDIAPEDLSAFWALGDTPAFRLFTPDLTRLALILTAYAAFVHRVSGDDRAVIALPVHNRLTPQDRATIGLFVEVLPWAIDVQGSDSFSKLFERVKDGLGGFLKAAKPGAVAAVEAGTPACVLNFLHAKFDDFAQAPSTAQWLHSGSHDAHHPIRLHVMDFDGAGAQLALDVHDDLLEGRSAQDVAGHLSRVIKAMAQDTSQPIDTVALSSSAEITRIAQLTQGAPAQYGDDVPVLEQIATQVARTPQAIALRQGDIQVTYGDLWHRAGGIAAQVSTADLPPGPIAIHMARSIELMVSILGVMRAGRTFVPIAANTAEARLKTILDAAGVVAGLGDQTTARRFTQAGVLSLPHPQTGADHQDPELSPIAYVLFTSGSTGIPKGVEVTQRGLAGYISWATRTFSKSGLENYALFSSLSFDLTITSIFTPLTYGGSVVIYLETSENDLAVLEVFEEDAVDVVKLTPSHLALVCAVGRPVSRIKTLVLGGENLAASLCQRARKVLGSDIEFLNEYGPTEAVVGAMVHRFDPARDTGASVPIGRPADGVTLTLRDAGLVPVPPGVKGEICIAGRLAAGYLGQPDLTAEKFVTTPDGERIYRTGDLGRLRMDGVFEYLGRDDQQLKINGVRIEKAEIENALMSVPGVQTAHVALPLQHTKVNQSGHQNCVQCGLPSNYPNVTFDSTGLCQICADFDSYKDRAAAYFRTEPELEAKVVDAAAKSRGAYDAVMLLSGGKDSTYAAYRLGALTNRVLAVTLDNGFIAEVAKANIARVARDLGWDHRFLTTDKMNQIFVDSLNTHANVCQGCFKAIYTLAIRTARAEGAPIVITGLSRGQFFETRLTPELFQNAAPTCSQLEDMVDRARRRYHAENDAVARLLETEDLADGKFLEDVEIVDLYRYIDVPVAEIYRFLKERGTWRRPDDTGRSTNCLINDAGIHEHKRRHGFHNYALPYSWDVRMGHKTRAEAMDELADEIESDSVAAIMGRIGYTAADQNVGDAKIVAYAVSDQELSEQSLMDALRARLPREAVPARIVVVNDLALTSNGKVDTARLPAPSAHATQSGVTQAPDEPPSTPTEQKLAQIIQQICGLSDIGRHTDFFDLGIDSLASVQIAMRANELGLALPTTAVFEARTLAALAQIAEIGDSSAAQSSAFAETDHAGPTDILAPEDLDIDDEDLAGLAQALS